MVGFVKGTKVLTATNKYKNIENIKIGDEVLSYNEETKQFERNTVVNTFKDNCEEITKYTFDDNTILIGCEDLVFLTSSGWKEDIDVGDEIICNTGITKLVSEELIGVDEIYELDIEPIDNFVVSGIVVHNPPVCNECGNFIRTAKDHDPLCSLYKAGGSSGDSQGGSSSGNTVTMANRSATYIGEISRTTIASYTTEQLQGWVGLCNDTWSDIENINTIAIGDIGYFVCKNSNTGALIHFFVKIIGAETTTKVKTNNLWFYDTTRQTSSNYFIQANKLNKLHPLYSSFPKYYIDINNCFETKPNVADSAYFFNTNGKLYWADSQDNMTNLCGNQQLLCGTNFISTNNMRLTAEWAGVTNINNNFKVQTDTYVCASGCAPLTSSMRTARYESGTAGIYYINRTATAITITYPNGNSSTLEALSSPNMIPPRRLAILLCGAGGKGILTSRSQSRIYPANMTTANCFGDKTWYGSGGGGGGGLCLIINICDIREWKISVGTGGGSGDSRDTIMYAKINDQYVEVGRACGGYDGTDNEIPAYQETGCNGGSGGSWTIDPEVTGRTKDQCDYLFSKYGFIPAFFVDGRSGGYGGNGGVTYSNNYGIKVNKVATDGGSSGRMILYTGEPSSRTATQGYFTGGSASANTSTGYGGGGASLWRHGNYSTWGSGGGAGKYSAGDGGFEIRY